MRYCVLFFLVFSLLLVPVLAAGQPPSKCIFFRVSWEEDGTYKISELRAVMDFPLAIDQNGNFLIKLADSKGITLYQHKTKKYNMALEPSREPLEGEIATSIAIIDQDELIGTKKGQMFFLLPYLGEAKTLSFEHGSMVLAKADLSALCNNNSQCEEPENYLSCEKDCLLEKEDNYCYAYKDGVCDPDCIEGIDPDCAEETPEPTPPPVVDTTVPALLALTVAAIAVLLLLRKGKRSSKNRF